MPTGSPMPTNGRAVATLTAEILSLKAERDALIIAHNYQRPEIHDLAHVVADSLRMARRATESAAPASVVCAAHLTAQTAPIATPEQHALIPDPGAGPPLAHTSQ